nr:MAG TPA: hypothetical protein [Caudoviricetes sp.]
MARLCEIKRLDYGNFNQQRNRQFDERYRCVLDVVENCIQHKTR